MAINSNFNIYEPEAWVETALTNLYPNRPMVSNARTNVAGADIEGLVASANDTVKITRAVKPDGSPNSYSGSYNSDTPDANEEVLQITNQEYRLFSIDKRDQKFSLPDLVSQHFTPRLHNLIDEININVKSEARKFEAAFADKNTDATVLDDEDLAKAKQFLMERKNMDFSMPKLGILDPRGENDLTGLQVFQEADKRGNSAIQLSGTMGQAYGFQFGVDNVGSDHTVATVTDATVDGGESAGTNTVTIDDGAGGDATLSLNEGDVIYFGSADGENDYYVVESQTATVLTLKEELRASVADDATINPVDVASSDTGKEQFFYDPEAIALVTAVMQSVDSPSGSGVRRAAGFEPMNVINYTLTIEETKSGADILIETLYGTHNFYEDRGIRYIRGNVAKA